jgi:RsiW-degrading membrane proteinase PrsW (M82 family)
LLISDSRSLLGGRYFYLILGIISLSAGVVSTCTGVAWARFGRVIYRSKQPKEFWEDVVACYLIGVCFIGYFLYQVYRI